MIGFVTVTGTLLHGSPGCTPLDRLDPHQANDASKRAGNLRAVYATRLLDVAILHATFNRPLLQQLFGSYYLGYRIESGRVHLTASSDVAGWAAHHPDELWTDGYIYVLDEDEFTPVDDAERCSEFFALTPQRPIDIIRISSAASRGLFSFGG